MHLSMEIPRGGRGGGGVRARGGFDGWDYPPCRAFHRAKRPQGRDIWLWPTEAWYLIQSVPRGFLKVTLQLEKGMKFLFVLIAIIRYFKLSSKQIMSILRKFLSSSSHLIVKLDWNRIPPWKSEDFLRVTDPTCSDMLSRYHKAISTEAPQVQKKVAGVKRYRCRMALKQESMHGFFVCQDENKWPLYRGGG